MSGFQHTTENKPYKKLLLTLVQSLFYCPTLFQEYCHLGWELFILASKLKKIVEFSQTSLHSVGIRNRISVKLLKL